MQGSYAMAVEGFDAVAPALEEGSDHWRRMRWGRIEALAHVDPARGLREVREMGAREPLDLDRYYQCAKPLVAAQAVDEATELLREAWAANPGERALENLALDLVHQTDETGKLADMGYTAGGDNEHFFEDPEIYAQVLAVLEG